MNETSDHSGIITKSIALSILVPIFMVTTSFFAVPSIGLDAQAGVTSKVGASDSEEASASSYAEKVGSVTYTPTESASNEKDVSEPTNMSATESGPVFYANDWRLILVNKQHPIPEDYTFPIGDINSYMQCDERILKSLMRMLSAANKEEIYIFVASPYRSDDKQDEIFSKNVNNFMNEGLSFSEAYIETSQEITIPGTSEHQIGLAVDIIIDYYTTLDAGFAGTKAYKWLKENCADYGFIERYPKGKEEITGIGFEPWHFRYVGEEAARIIMQEGITLEEFRDEYLVR